MRIFYCGWIDIGVRTNNEDIDFIKQNDVGICRETIYSLEKFNISEKKCRFNFIIFTYQMRYKERTCVSALKRYLDNKQNRSVISKNLVLYVA